MGLVARTALSVKRMLNVRGRTVDDFAFTRQDLRKFRHFCKMS